MKRLLTIVLCAVALAGSAVTAMADDESADALTPKDWLRLAPDDDARFALLEQYLRGYDRSMWEIGDRYQVIYDALTLENYDLALYHWSKIRTTLVNGNLKRPDRQANSEAFFLDSTWADVKEDFESRDPKIAWEGFDLARTACMTCHEAENIAYMNEQPLFIDTEVP
ncbi:MAG: hypothetical protein AAF563_10575 [Pseudomonadota bacterium]